MHYNHYALLGSVQALISWVADFTPRLPFIALRDIVPHMKLTLSIIDIKLAVCRLSPQDPIPGWVTNSMGTFMSITRTSEELSIVCEQAIVPAGVEAQTDWCLFKVEGPLDFSLTGILASILDPLAKAKISIFAISTFDTDYIMLKEANKTRAIETLRQYFHINA